MATSPGRPTVETDEETPAWCEIRATENTPNTVDKAKVA